MVVLLAIIYVSFISLGLPDAILGSAWPVMYEQLGVAVSSAGIVSMVVAGGTIISSLFSNRLIKKMGTGPVTVISVGMTAAALLGISFSGTFLAICLWAVPLGLGAGSVDAGLNNFVALHYKASHMNWLHSFWGIGASIGPVLISFFLVKYSSWKAGYRAISIIQFALVAVLLLSLPLWKKAQAADSGGEAEKQKSLSIPQLVKLPRAKPTLVAFFCYCALESTVGLWGSTYLVLIRGIQEDIAAGWISLYYFGITLGRMLSGFLAMKLTQKKMIRIGQGLIAAGVLVLFLPIRGSFAVAGFFLIGLGCAPIFPSLLHETPNTFGKEYSQAIMGMQMACAYVGSTFMPPLFGFLGAKLGYGLFPFYLAVLLALMVFMVVRIYSKKTGEKI